MIVIIRQETCKKHVMNNNTQTPERNDDNENEKMATQTAVNPNPAANGNIQRKLDELTPEEKQAATDNVGSEITDGEGG